MRKFLHRDSQESIFMLLTTVQLMYTSEKLLKKLLELVSLLES